MHTSLVCLPFAGAGASFFRKWRPLAPEQLTLVPVQLPGREERFHEPLPTDIGAAMDEACAWVIGQVAGATSIALYGHSFGAELAYELTRRLRGHGVPVDRLFVSGSPGPRDRHVERVSDLPDAEFLEGLRRVAGYRHPAMDNPDMLEIMLPFIRADNRMHENYRSAYDTPLDVPISSIRGQDDHLVTTAEVAAWAAETSAEFSLVEIDGGHMYLTDNPAVLLKTVVMELERGA